MSSIATFLSTIRWKEKVQEFWDWTDPESGGKISFHIHKIWWKWTQFNIIHTSSSKNCLQPTAPTQSSFQLSCIRRIGNTNHGMSSLLDQFDFLIPISPLRILIYWHEEAEIAAYFCEYGDCTPSAHSKKEKRKLSLQAPSTKSLSQRHERKRIYM